jgi:hypothetical protein
VSERVGQALITSAELVEALATKTGTLAILLEELAAQNAEYENLAALRRPQTEAVVHAIGDAVSRVHRHQVREARLHLLVVLFTAVPLGVLAILLTGLLFHK